ncbi:MAG: 50S ribosomal protein L25 [Nitrospirota bacterium]|nr:50S ribosomal protein L25 [Nitrospirota bacterium]MDE3119014.1 50S ribosomal protein L25 [Nitrospirota bacterium]MDE3226321.1 50S ribosomal protein L25 [Nitrospirota bacterium]MDE3242590.1 50S ribosomal protein L25 [Nitrospirota bacterium]
MKFDMAAEVREKAGKGVARQLRRIGKVPAVLYGEGECLLLTVDPSAVIKILRGHAGSTALINVSLTGAASKPNRTALLREYQVDPVSGELLHVDLFEISMSKPIRVKVPVSVVGGMPAGVKEGGVLHHNLRELHIECLPAALPDAIEVDASNLAIGQGVHVKELTPVAGVKILDEAEQMVVSVAAPISEAKLEALLTSGAAAEEGKEPEVIGKGKEEGAEGAEKAAAPAGEAKPGEKKEAAAGAAKGEKKEAKEEKKK